MIDLKKGQKRLLDVGCKKLMSVVKTVAYSAEESNYFDIRGMPKRLLLSEHAIFEI